MGGSVGHMSVELASQHPDLILVVQDFAALEPQFHKTVPKDLNSRISFQVHDFFVRFIISV
jgi:6-hydroxytryprostatin B O-methyltransferase